jgi:hypothetical protein
MCSDICGFGGQVHVSGVPNQIRTARILANSSPFRSNYRSISWGWDCVAETERFELSVPFKRYDALAKRWFQPLTHVSRPGGKPWL